MLGVCAPTGLILALAFLTAPTALAGQTSVKDKGAAGGKGLTRSERRALDIDRVTARGTAAGLVVRVRFKGDIQRVIGRGHLKRALVAVVLRPRSRRARPAALGTKGRVGRAETLRGTRSSAVEVVRDGKKVDFLILGAGLRNVSRIEAVAFRAPPRRRRRSRTADERLSPAAIERLLDSKPADEAGLRSPNPDPSVCRLLRADAVTYARQEEQRSNERIQAILRDQSATVDKLNETIPQIKKARSRLRPVLGRNRCFKVEIVNLGYEHYQGFTRICGDLLYDVPVALFQPGAYRLFRLNEQTGAYEEVAGAFNAGGLASFTTVGVSFRIEQYGTYKVVFKDRDLAGAVERLITVPPPDPQLTRDCG